MELSIDIEHLAQIVLLGRELERGEYELRGLIEALDTDAQAELVAIMWIGRGSFGAEEWVDAVETAEREATTPCADYLIGTPHFTDHVEAGLEALEISLRDEEEAFF